MTGSGWRIDLGSWALAGAVGALILASPAAAQEMSTDGVTFARDVAPILQENCQSCHRPGGMGPMPLVTYEDARPFAPLIRDRVENRRMPPWYIEPGIGVQDFKNDISLSDDQIRTIVSWVDGGAVLGDVADLPAPLDFDDSLAWKLQDHFGRPPDLVVASPPYTVPAEGLDHWYEPTSYVEGLDEPRWAMATEIRPGDVDSRYVFPPREQRARLVGRREGLRPLPRRLR